MSDDLVKRLRTRVAVGGMGRTAKLNPDGDEAIKTIEALTAEVAELKALEFTFDLRHKADMRAIKRWQDATGRTMTWPDHADLCVWLLEQGDKTEAEAARLREVILWADGQRGEWPERKDGEGPYYWRRELMRRAALRGEEG